MTDDRDPLARLRRLDAEATPGPWEVHQSRRQALDNNATVEHRNPRPTLADEVAYDISADDARLIATLRTLLPELIAVAETGRAFHHDRWHSDDGSRFDDNLAEHTAALDALDAAIRRHLPGDD